MKSLIYTSPFPAMSPKCILKSVEGATSYLYLFIPASVVPGCCLLALCYIGCNRAAAVALMAIAITCIGGMFCGFLSNHIDIAPNFAGTLMAITNTVATLPGIVVPIFVGYLTHSNVSYSNLNTYLDTITKPPFLPFYVCT